MRREMAAHFSYKFSEATIFHALQQLEIGKVCACRVSKQFMEEHRKNHTGMALNFFTQTRRMGMTYSSE